MKIISIIFVSILCISCAREQSGGFDLFHYEKIEVNTINEWYDNIETLHVFSMIGWDEQYVRQLSVLDSKMIYVNGIGYPYIDSAEIRIEQLPRLDDLVKLSPAPGPFANCLCGPKYVGAVLGYDKNSDLLGVLLLDESHDSIRLVTNTGAEIIKRYSIGHKEEFVLRNIIEDVYESLNSEYMFLRMGENE